MKNTIDISKGKGKSKSKKPSKKKEAPSIFDLNATPQFLTPGEFPEHAHPVLRRNRLTKRQFSKHGEQLSMFLAANGSADAARMLQLLVRLGDLDALKLFFKVIGLDKSAPQTVVNLQQDNRSINVSEGAHEKRAIDSLVRQLDDRDRKQIAAPVIEAETA